MNNHFSSRRISSALIIVAVAFVTACARPSIQTYFNPEADLGYYEKVGVVPFRALTADRLAGEKFAIEFVTALFASELFEVVDYGIFVNAMTKAIGTRTVSDGISAEHLAKIQEATGIQAVFVGSVLQYDMVASGGNRFPVISVEVRLVDAAAARVVWSATITERGGPKTPLIGIGEVHTLGELSQHISQRLLKELE